MDAARTGALIAALGCLAIAAAGCGSDPVCGDGNTDFEEGEQCDDANNIETDLCLNNCQLRPIPKLTVKWEFNEDESRGFTGDSCLDIGARTVEVDFVGPNTNESEVIDCSFRQAVYEDIPTGMYTVTLRVMSNAGAMLTTVPFEHTLTFSGGTEEEELVIIPHDAWNLAYKGSFFFRLGWGAEPGESCESAVPMVATNQLLLEINGTPYAGVTDVGDPVDGTAFVPCRALSEGAAQTVLDVPFGPADFSIIGRNAAGDITHQGSFETFVGAGPVNPEMRFDVAPVDAGPDAALDAGL